MDKRVITSAMRARISATRGRSTTPVRQVNNNVSRKYVGLKKA